MASHCKIILTLYLSCLCDNAVAQNTAARDCPKNSRPNSIGPCTKVKANPSKKSRPSSKHKSPQGSYKDRLKPPQPDKPKTPNGSQLPEIEGDKF